MRFPSLYRLSGLILLSITVGCSHPLEISGSGDINAVGDGNSCSMENAPCPNVIVGNYFTTYTAVARAGYGFLRWDNCLSPPGDQCSFSIPASTVRAFWFQTLVPLRANFSPHIPGDDLSGDFATSVDCDGHIVPPGGEAVVRFRSSTTVAGENQGQCIGNGIFYVPSLNTNFLVWVDVLHLDGQGQVVYDIVNGESPIREIIGNFGEPFIVGKTYTLDGVSLPAAAPISIEITWVDIDATFGAFTQCYITESQTPIGTTTRRKTYCPRGDGSYEIKENIALP